MRPDVVPVAELLCFARSSSTQPITSKLSRSSSCVPGSSARRVSGNSPGQRVQRAAQVLDLALPLLLHARARRSARCLVQTRRVGPSRARRRSERCATPRAAWDRPRPSCRARRRRRTRGAARCWMWRRIELSACSRSSSSGLARRVHAMLLARGFRQPAIDRGDATPVSRRVSSKPFMRGRARPRGPARSAGSPSPRRRRPGPRWSLSACRSTTSTAGSSLGMPGAVTVWRSSLA